jgi:hypothetical protein
VRSYDAAQNRFVPYRNKWYLGVNKMIPTQNRQWEIAERVEKYGVRVYFKKCFLHTNP